MAEFNIFAENSFIRVVEAQKQKIRERIDRESQNYILNVNEEEYLTHIVSEFEINPLTLEFNQRHITTREAAIPAEQFGRGYAVHPGRSYTKQVITYHIPFSGDPALLHCHPNPGMMNSCRVYIDNHCVCFDIVDFSGNPEDIKREYESTMRIICGQADSLTKNVADYNAQLRALAQDFFHSRRNVLLERNKVVEALGVPIKKASNIPQTFAVPAARKKITPRPQASVEAYRPEPTLDATTYEEILQVIQDTGRVFERLPSTYADKNEETLRDHLLLQLEPRFEGSSTGETFNKSGKTDILIRHEKKNVFVAECKFWKGEKAHHQTIDQILSYLTWRDSKSAIVYFVPTKEISPILKVIEESTGKHPCFVKFNGKKEESWFRFIFHLPDDSGRSIHLAILCFHIPSVK